MKADDAKRVDGVKEYKEALRLFLKEKRAKISKKQRKYAREDCYAELKTLLHLFPYVLSFASTDDEINLDLLNRDLAKEGRLLLPKVVDDYLVPHLVTDLDKQLKPSKWGICEPISSKTEEIKLEKISCLLVPALGFDTHKHRLGYGMGYYDRLIHKLAHTPAFGIGFKEQMVSDPLPIEPHDRRLTRLYLF